MLQSISIEKRERVPAINIYYLTLYILSQAHTENEWEQLIQFLQTDIEQQLSHADISTNIIFAFNYCSKQLHNGNNNFLKQHFVLYKLMLEKGYLMKRNQLSDAHYKNIVRVASRAGEFEWGTEFANKYKEKISQENQENYYQLNLGTIAFYQKDYDVALECLRMVEQNNTADHISINMMLIKTYYMLMTQQKGAFYADALDSTIHALKMYFLRNKMAVRVKYKQHQNFLNLITSFIKLRDKLLYHKKKPQLKERFQKLKNKINASETVDKKWLLEQLEGENSDVE